MRRSWAVLVASVVMTSVVMIAGATPSAAAVAPSSGSGTITQTTEEGLVITTITSTTSVTPASIEPGQPVSIQVVDTVSSKPSSWGGGECNPSVQEPGSWEVFSWKLGGMEPGQTTIPTLFGVEIAGSGTAEVTAEFRCPPESLHVSTHSITLPGSSTAELGPGCYFVVPSTYTVLHTSVASGTVAVLSIGGLNCATPPRDTDCDDAQELVSSLMAQLQAANGRLAAWELALADAGSNKPLQHQLKALVRAAQKEVRGLERALRIAERDLAACEAALSS